MEVIEEFQENHQFEDHLVRNRFKFVPHSLRVDLRPTPSHVFTYQPSILFIFGIMQLLGFFLQFYAFYRLQCLDLESRGPSGMSKRSMIRQKFESTLKINFGLKRE